MKKTVILASALMMSAAMPAFAADGKNMSDSEKSAKVQEKFNELDADKNGAVSEKEHDAAGKSDSDFDAADTNDDDSLSLAELKAWQDKEWNQSSNASVGSNSVDNHGKAASSGTSSVGGANERVRSGDTTKTSH